MDARGESVAEKTNETLEDRRGYPRIASSRGEILAAVSRIAGTNRVAATTPERSADERADEVRSTTACALTPLMPNALHPANVSSERETRVVAGRGCLGATRPPPPADAATTCALRCRRCAMGGEMPRSIARTATRRVRPRGALGVSGRALGRGEAKRPGRERRDQRRHLDGIAQRRRGAVRGDGDERVERIGLVTAAIVRERADRVAHERVLRRAVRRGERRGSTVLVRRRRRDRDRGVDGGTRRGVPVAVVIVAVVPNPVVSRVERFDKERDAPFASSVPVRARVEGLAPSLGRERAELGDGRRRLGAERRLTPRRRRRRASLPPTRAIRAPCASRRGTTNTPCRSPRTRL